LDQDYKIERSTEHRAKFCADRRLEITLRDYGDRRLRGEKKEEKTTAKHKSFRKLSFSGGLEIMTLILYTAKVMTV